MNENQIVEYSEEEKPRTPRRKQFKKVDKYSIRKKIWDHLAKNKISLFPGAYGRNPNFKGAEQATSKLLELEEFNSAKSVEVNPDKPLEFARKLVLEKAKELYVHLPGRLKGGVLKKLELVEGTDISKIVTRLGMEQSGKLIGIDDVVHIDLLVLGSVAVSKDGRRIGKGSGYADLEFALLKELKAIDDSTVIVTIVHDSQIIDDMPKDIFEKYDVPADYILTPTQIIKVEHRLPKPEGIFWNELSPRRLNMMESLVNLKQKHEREGKDTTLKADTEGESPIRRPFYRSRFIRKKPRQENGDSEDGKKKPSTAEVLQSENKKDVAKELPKRYRSSKYERAKSTETDDTGENYQNIRPPLKPKRYFRKPLIGYSLRISNIQRSVRVRDLKNALIEKGIKPNSITWKGYRGFCYLHYHKKLNNTENKENENSAPMDEVIGAIQDLKLNPDAGKVLNVKVMEPLIKEEPVAAV